MDVRGNISAFILVKPLNASLSTSYFDKKSGYFLLLVIKYTVVK
jgi:hypothetical protein